MRISKHRDIERAEQTMDTYLEDLKTIVNIDSGTFTKAGIDRVGAYLQERFQAFGFSTRFDRQEEYGDHLIGTHIGQASHGPRVDYAQGNRPVRGTLSRDRSGWI